MLDGLHVFIFLAVIWIMVIYLIRNFIGGLKWFLFGVFLGFRSGGKITCLQIFEEVNVCVIFNLNFVMTDYECRLLRFLFWGQEIDLSYLYSQQKLAEKSFVKHRSEEAKKIYLFGESRNPKIALMLQLILEVSSTW